MTELQIGSIVWKIDLDNFRYRRTRRAADQLKQLRINGENKRSWLIGFESDADKDPNACHHYKVDKKTLKTLGKWDYGHGAPAFLFNEKQRDDYIWQSDNRHKLIEFIRTNVQDVTVLRALAAIAGYQEVRYENT